MLAGSGNAGTRWYKHWLDAESAVMHEAGHLSLYMYHDAEAVCHVSLLNTCTFQHQLDIQAQSSYNPASLNRFPTSHKILKPCSEDRSQTSSAIDAVSAAARPPNQFTAHLNESDASQPRCLHSAGKHLTTTHRRSATQGTVRTNTLGAWMQRPIHVAVLYGHTVDAAWRPWYV
ncbi:hypothetical protein M440DRAFT_1215367 [Trichoderma longibrachiatum ATCC 18648]|uniref:Uncharacterized protein n=1 Tax=Trichoderma longibrachiatum ATCC 18648 TaxID=983965 RepID=A0A2T4C7J7_TRILO|nr:hypothetical protein M440DRAFT_1215367 [Trichoderma longibrachiatum ATCC 18648]